MKSRLIDAYTEGLIEHREFKIKITNIKMRLSSIEKQIEETQGVADKQYELFLIVNHLEEFERKIKHKIHDISFEEKRSVIRSIVKRIEIYRNKIIVVFRVEPLETPPGSSGTQRENREPTTKQENNFMQDCKRSKLSVVGEPFSALRV